MSHRRMGKFQVYPISKSAWYYRILGGNGECLAVGDGDGDGYVSKSNARRGAEDCRDAICQVVAGGVEIEELDYDPCAGSKSKKTKAKEPDEG